MEKQINEVKAQLKYGQLDEFSREQLEKKLQDLYDQKAETEWQRNAQARKDAANARYDTQQKTYNAQIDSIIKACRPCSRLCRLCRTAQSLWKALSIIIAQKTAQQI